MDTVTGRLTEKEQQVLRHLEQAEELGSTLSDYARAFGVNVQELYAGKAQLQRKGYRSKNTEVAKPELLAVRVIEPAVDVSEACVCRVAGPGGWVLECRQWPEPSWIAAVMRTSDRSAS